MSYAATYTYNPVGNRLTRSDAAAGVTTYAYRAGGRLTTITPSSGAPTTVTYDLSGSLTSEVTGSVRTTYTYGYEDRLLHAAYPSGASVTNFYSADGLCQASIDHTGAAMHVGRAEHVHHPAACERGEPGDRLARGGGGLGGSVLGL